MFVPSLDDVLVWGIFRKLDYFARRRRDGWDAYGDEIVIK